MPVFVLAVSLIAFEASALLKTGSTLGDFKVHDYQDKAFSLSALYAGKAALIIFEDKDSGGQNQAFKKRLAPLQKTAGGKVVLIPVADVSKYDYWPAKGFVKDALRDAGRKNGVKVYADWSGKMRTALGASAKRSHLVLVDKNRKVLWASAGKLTKTQEDKLLDLIRDAAR
jgi:peroxiredoxin